MSLEVQEGCVLGGDGGGGYTPSIFPSTEILQSIPVIASRHPIVTLGAHSLLRAILQAACWQYYLPVLQ